MRAGKSIVSVGMFLCAGIVWAQKPPSPLIQDDDPAPVVTPAPDPFAKAPLTEQQLREQQIRLMDPLFRGDPLADPAEEKEKAATPRGAERPPDAPLKGSVASSGQAAPAPGRRGPQVIAAESDAAMSNNFAGPAVLSRSYTLHRPMIVQQVQWNSTVSLNSTYNSGMTGNAVQAGGTLGNQSSFGTSAGWSVSGSHAWRHSTLSVATSGNLNQFLQASSFNGSNQNININYGHQLSPHLTLNISESAASYSQSYTLTNPGTSIETSIANVNISASPVVQLLDSGFRQSSTSVSLGWQKSARLSFNFGSSYFGVARTGVGLIGNVGFGANADVNYRLSRKTTVGLAYSFSDYRFARRVQISNTNTYGVIYSYALSRSMQFRSRVGITQIESEGRVAVPIDPFIAALLGQTSRIVDQYRKNATSDISAEIAKDLGKTRTARISFARGVSPGNGVQLTSLQQSLTGGFSMTVGRRYTLDLGGGNSKLSSAGQTIGQYDSRYASLGIGRGYRGGVSANFNANYRTFNITNTLTNRNQFSLGLGLSWSRDPTHLF